MSLLFWAAVIGGSALAAKLLGGHVTENPNFAPPKQLPGSKALQPKALSSAPSLSDPPKPNGATTSEPVYVYDEVEALGRVIASEIGRGTRREKVAVAWVTRNLARQRKQSIAEMACQPCGKQVGRKRPVSSRFRARPIDLEIAAEVLASPDSADPTGGAEHFINPPLQDKLAAEGRPGYVGKPYAVVRDRWLNKYEWEPYGRLGKKLELWGPKKS